MLVRPTQRPTSVEELIPRELAARLDRLDVLSRRVFAGTMQGERRSKRRGQSVEFADHRPYVAGDDLRRIDWNILARLDRLFVKVFQQEEDLSLHLVLDASPSMEAGGAGPSPLNKLLFAQRLAMALGYIGLVNNNRLSVWVFGNGPLRRLPPARGRAHVRRLAAFLLGAVGPAAGGGAGGGGPRAPVGSFTAAMRGVAAAGTGAGVLVLLSDLLVPEGYEEGLARLGAMTVGAARYDVTCLQVLAPGELDPAVEGGGAGGRGDGGGGVLGDLRLTDAETGREVEVTVTPELVKQYKDSVRRYCEGIRAFCAARGTAHAVVTTDTPVESLILDSLRKRGLLG